MNITKIKFTDNVTEVYYTSAEGSTDIETRVKCAKPRDPQFTKKMFELVPGVVRILELPEAWIHDDLEIIGLALKNADDGVGVVVTLTKKFERFNSPLVINSPYFIADFQQGGLDQIVYRIKEHAIAFAKGKREQKDMFDQNDDDHDSRAEHLSKNR